MWGECILHACKIGIAISYIHISTMIIDFHLGRDRRRTSNKYKHGDMYSYEREKTVML